MELVMHTPMCLPSTSVESLDSVSNKGAQPVGTSSEAVQKADEKPIGLPFHGIAALSNI
jgi:hypothetical protein